MKPINFSVIGTGAIASIMTETISQMPEYKLYAVAGSSQEKAALFADTHGYIKHFGSCEELVLDSEVEMLYIASPHSLHAEHAALALKHHIPVLCEKSFTVNAAEAKKLVQLAQENNTLLAEAIWPRYSPIAQKLTEYLAEGVIGQVTALNASLGAPLSNVPRMYMPHLAGGALLDLGVYPITFACIALGSIYTNITSSVNMYHTGVDAFSSFILQHSDGSMASLQCNMLNSLDNNCYIYGTKGTIKVNSVTNYSDLYLYNEKNELVEHFHPEPKINGYEYQLIAFANALNKNTIECAEMPHAESIRVMEIMDTLRYQWNLKFPFEG